VSHAHLPHTLRLCGKMKKFATRTYKYKGGSRVGLSPSVGQFCHGPPRAHHTPRPRETLDLTLPLYSPSIQPIAFRLHFGGHASLMPLRSAVDVLDTVCQVDRGHQDHMYFCSSASVSGSLIVMLIMARTMRFLVWLALASSLILHLAKSHARVSFTRAFVFAPVVFPSAM